MLKDIHMPGLTVPNPSIKKGTINEKLLEFIEVTLYKFQTQFKGEVAASEEELNEHLGKTLSYYSKSESFIFQQETIQKQTKGQNRKVDIGVFRHYADINPFFTIEAKRLNTKIARHREKEYIIGDDPTKLSGGIERYKHNVHGVNLNRSAIIGYIQTEDAKYWFNKINYWIGELIMGNIKSNLSWFANDFLTNTCGFNEIALSKFISESEKINFTKINLNHYFICLNPPNLVQEG